MSGPYFFEATPPEHWPEPIRELYIEEYTPRDTEQNAWVLKAFFAGADAVKKALAKTEVQP